MTGMIDQYLDDVCRRVLMVPPPISCADWADKFFYLSPESSNSSGLWKTTTVQRAILNAMGNDSIEKVDFFKSARFGGTKMLVIAGAYNIVHKGRNTCFYQPTKGDSDDFVKGEVEPAIRDCEGWGELLLSGSSEKSSKNTLSYKAFQGCNLHFRGGHSPNSFRRLTLDTVILDELDGFQADVGREGNPSTLAWGRIKNSVFKKQIQISTPLITGFSLIEQSSKAAVDILKFHVECPHCGEFNPIEFGGKDTPYGFKWEGRDASTVLNYCQSCAAGWGNNKLNKACSTGYWLGENGHKTYDGLAWSRVDPDTGDETPCGAPRHIAFKSWSAYSPFSPWTQIIEEWYDAQGDIKKLQAFTNTTLGETWDIKYSGTMTAEIVDSIIPTDDISDVVAITAGIDVQDDRLEVQWLGHDLKNNMYVLDYDIIFGDLNAPDAWVEMAKKVLRSKWNCGTRVLGVANACIDTQGSHTAIVHKFLMGNKKSGVFIGINGNPHATYEIADQAGTYKDVKGSSYYSIGVNPLKQKTYSAIRNFDKDSYAFRIYSGARLPDDYADQLTVEKMEIRRVNGKDKIAFTNKGSKRNECLDTVVYGLAAKAYIKKHRRQGSRLFGD